MAEEIIIKYKADVSGLKTEYEDIKKTDKEVRDKVEEPMKVDADLLPLKKQLKLATADVIRLTNEFGVTSKQAAEAAKKAADLKHEITEATKLTKAFSPVDKFKALSSSVETAIGGFQAYQGAITLVGNKSENVEKAILKLEAVMALSSGVKQLGEAQDSFKALGSVIKNNAVFQSMYSAATRIATAVQSAFGVATVATSGGFKLLRAAIVSTGIGALVVVLGLVIANFDSISRWIKNSPIGALANSVGNLVEKFTDLVGITSEAERSIEHLSKANKRANEDINARISLLKAQGGSEQQIYELSKKAIQNDLAVYRLTLKKKGSLTEEEAAKFRELKNKEAELTAENNTRISEENKKAAEKAKEAQKKADEDAKKALEQKRKDAIDNEKAIVDAILKENDRLVNGLNANPVEKQNKNIAKLQAANVDPKVIEEEQQLLLKYETNLNNQKYKILLDSLDKEKAAKEKAIKDATKNGLGEKTIKEITDFYDASISKLTDDATNLNKTILGQIDTYNNKNISIGINYILEQKNAKDFYDEIDNREKAIKDRKTNSKLDELKKERDLINIQNERDAMDKKALEEKKAKLDEFLKSQGISPSLSVDSKKLQEEIDAIATKIRENTTVDVNLKISEESKNLLKTQLDNIFAFANSTLFVQLGLDPNSVNQFKSQVESAVKFIQKANDKNASAEDQQKARNAAALAATQAAATAVIAGIDMVTASEKAASEQRIAQLNADKEAELAAAGDNEQKKEIIRQKYDQKIKAEKRKQFEAEKRANIVKAIMNTAVAIAAVLDTPFLIPIVAAIGAAQVALIASQPTPKFKDGGIVGKPISDGLLSGKPHSAGGILLEAEGGEYIINKKSTQNHLPLIEAINDGSINDMLNKHYIMPAIENAEKNAMQRNEKRISDIQTLIVNKAINQTLKSIERKGDINTSRIVEAVKGDKFTL